MTVRCHQRSRLSIPEGVQSEAIMYALKSGHGYSWTVLSRDPLLVAHGNPSVQGMPQLLLLGNQNMVVSGGEIEYVKRLNAILEMLHHRKATRQDSIGGVSHS